MARNPADDRPIDILNSSGFPFQLGVQREIERTTTGEHGWEVAAREFPWRHPETGREGFADLVIQHRSFVFTLLIECKRVRDGRWFFLTPPGDAASTGLSAFWTASHAGNSPDVWGWSDFGFEPASPEAAFCVFRTQDEKNPLIERVADELLQAVEAVGMEELRMKAERQRLLRDHRLFLPVIVTNAVLYTASFDAGSVSMETGLVDEGSCEFKVVPSVRIRKGLITTYPNRGAVADGRSSNGLLRSAGAIKDRSVLVINSASIASILGLIRIPRNLDYDFGRHLEWMISQALREPT